MKFDKFDHIQARNPFDMAEGGTIRDTSTRLEYLFTARAMRQTPMPTPVNKAAITSELNVKKSFVGILQLSAADVLTRQYYDGLMTIDDQPSEAKPEGSTREVLRSSLPY